MSVERGSRRRDVQGLRALAVLMVVLFHAGLHLPGGFTGVDVFFVISGFVITRMLARELAETGRIRLLRFYGRRAKRLLPALALVVSCVVVAGILLDTLGVQMSTAKTGLATEFFAANAYLYAAVWDSYFNWVTQLNPLLHTWTLAVEEQFYVAFPALLLFGWRRAMRRERSRRGSAMTTIAIVSVASFLVSIWFSYNLPLPVGWPRPSGFAFYSSPTRAWEFGVGALLALQEDRLAKLPRRAAAALGVAGLAAILAGAFSAPVSQFPGLYALLPVGGAAAIVAAGTAGSLGASRLLETRVATWIGDRSYSWYLWHWPFIVDARAIWPGSGWVVPVAAAASIVPSWASYKYVENPVRFHPRLYGRRIAFVGTACVATGVAACFALVAGHRLLTHVQVVRAAARSQHLHADLTHGCMNNPQTLPERLHDACTWRVAHPRGLIALIGDSNAGHFSEAVIAAGNAAGYDVVVDTNSDCPFVALRMTTSFNTTRFCLHATETALRGALAVKPTLLITADRTDGYVDNHQNGLARLDSNHFAYSPHAKAALWEEGLTTILTALNRARIPVLLVHPVPLQPGVTVRRCAVVRLLLQGCNTPVSRSQALSALRSVVRIEDRAAAHAPRTTTLSLYDALCNDAICPTDRHGTLLYFDSGHLSVGGDSLLARPFAVAIRRAVAAGNRRPPEHAVRLARALAR